MYNVDMKTEIWQDIPVYEGLYQASNLGRIKRKATVNDIKNRWAWQHVYI